MNAGPIYLSRPLPQANVTSGIALIDNTLLGTLNIAANINSVGNVLLNSMAAIGAIISVIGVGDGIVVVKKPYSKHRPSYKKGQVEETWENAKNREGKVHDPDTGKELFWDESKPRNGQWDMGHKGETYKKLHDKYMSDEISYEKFLKDYQDSSNYHPQSVNANRSRRYDK